jgi:hypothetical protein
MTTKKLSGYHRVHPSAVYHQLKAWAATNLQLTSGLKINERRVQVISAATVIMDHDALRGGGEAW